MPLLLVAMPFATRFTFSLLVRDFFHFFARKHGARIFHPHGLAPERPVWRGGDQVRGDRAGQQVSQVFWGGASSGAWCWEM